MTHDEDVMVNTFWMKYSSTLQNPNITSALEVAVYTNIWGIYIECNGQRCEPHQISEYMDEVAPAFDLSVAHSWDDVKSSDRLTEDGQDCADASASLTVLVITAGLIASFLNTVLSLDRADKSNDNYKKCGKVIGSVCPLIFNISTLSSFADDCNTAPSNADVHFGPGWYCLLVCLLAGNVPSLIIHLVIPAPDPFYEDIADTTEAEEAHIMDTEQGPGFQSMDISTPAKSMDVSTPAKFKKSKVAKINDA